MDLVVALSGFDAVGESRGGKTHRKCPRHNWKGELPSREIHHNHQVKTDVRQHLHPPFDMELEGFYHSSIGAFT